MTNQNKLNYKRLTKLVSDSGSYTFDKITNKGSFIFKDCSVLGCIKTANRQLIKNLSNYELCEYHINKVIDAIIKYQNKQSKILRNKIDYHKKYYLQNKDRIKKNQKKYYLQNKDRLIKNQKKYYLENKDNYKKYYLDNKDKFKIKQKKYYLKNRQKRLDYNKLYYIKNIERLKKYKIAYYQRQKEKKS